MARFLCAMKLKATPHNSKCRYGERGAADAVPQLPERCLSRKAGIVRCCPRNEILLRDIWQGVRNGQDRSLRMRGKFAAYSKVSLRHEP